ncbi:trafficking protein particle complex subunit 10-like isoform X2 [Paramacrobiotus metropolitanus]|uniref:trafficking protein particle complex subunit 10-like isoform X2 n=1 Tax=Paramacrobiotus metropolitanus TaxID=2943436 RepID=UPI002445C588|nr:trafficking protein particle complex subunit 10-like isoform X2 [Paramacrobiotus metropolitanus]
MEEYSEFSEERISFDIPQRSHSVPPKNFSVVTYSGSLDAFANVQEPFARDVAAECFNWRRSYGKVKDVYCHVQFQKFTELPTDLSSDPSATLLGPVLHSFWCDAQFVDYPRPSVRDQLTAWLEQLESKGVHDWIIVVLVKPDSKKSPRSKPTPRFDIYDKLNSEFCSKMKDRGRCVYIWDPRSGMGDAEVWHNAVVKFRHLIFEAYDAKLRAYEERVRIAREDRGKPGWMLTDYVNLREALASAYQKLEFPDEALWHLDDLDQGITQFVADAAQEAEGSHLRSQCSVPPKHWLGLTLTMSAKENWRMHHLVEAGNVSLLELRSFLFARQYDLLQETNRISELTARAILFIQNVNQDCKLFNVEIIPGALMCWTFLACHEIREIAQSSGDSSPLTLQNCATLLGLECEELARLGDLCGLMPNEEPSPEQSGIVKVLTSAIEAPRQSAAVLKLYDCLLSREQFMKNYLELSELTLGTFKHIGRSRAARHLGVTMAKYYMKWKMFEKAAAFLFDALKVLKDECWLLPSADVAVLYVQCMKEIQQWDQVVKAALLVVSCLQLSFDVRKEHFELFQQILSSKSQRDGIVIGSGNLLTATVPYPSEKIRIHFIDQKEDFIIFIDSNFPGPVRVDKCFLYLTYNSTGNFRRSARRLASLPLWDSDYLLATKPTMRQDLYLPCSSIPVQDDGMSGAGDAGNALRNFPNVKFGLVTKGRDSPSKSSISSAHMDLIGDPKADLCVECSIGEIVPGRNELTFRTTFHHPGIFQVRHLRIVHSPSLQFAVGVENIPLLQVVSDFPKCFVEPVDKNSTLWTNLPQIFRLYVTGAHSVKEIPFSISVSQTSAKVLNTDLDTEMQSGKLLLQTNYEKTFVVLCEGDTEDSDTEINVIFPWSATPCKFRFPFVSCLKVTTSLHSIPTIKPQEVVKLIWKISTHLNAPVKAVVGIEYLLDSSSSLKLCASSLVGQFGQMQLKILMTLPLWDNNKVLVHVGEAVDVEYQIDAVNVPSDLPALYYQLRYDSSFWNSNGETTGHLNLHENQNPKVRCAFIALKSGPVTYPVMRLFYLKNEEIVPMDPLHVYNESTCRSVHLLPRQNAADSKATAH